MYLWIILMSFLSKPTLKQMYSWCVDKSGLEYARFMDRLGANTISQDKCGAKLENKFQKITLKKRLVGQPIFQTWKRSSEETEDTKMETTVTEVNNYFHYGSWKPAVSFWSHIAKQSACRVQ